MDNKTFIASYVAKESDRLNQSLKDMLGRGAPPSNEEKDALLSDMEATLAKLTSALEYLSTHVDQLTKEEPVA